MEIQRQMKGMGEGWKNKVQEEKKGENMQKEFGRLQGELLVEKRPRDKMEILETMTEVLEIQENKKDVSQVEVPPIEEEEKVNKAG